MEEGITMTASVPSSVASPTFEGDGLAVSSMSEVIDVPPVADQALEIDVDTNEQDADMLLQIAKDDGFDKAFDWLSNDDKVIQAIVEEPNEVTEDQEEGEKEIVVGENPDLIERNKILEEENNNLKEKAQKDEEALRIALETMQLMALVLALENIDQEEEKSAWEVLVNIIGNMLQGIVMPDEESPIDKIGQEQKKKESVVKSKKKLTPDEMRKRVEEMRVKMGLPPMAMAA